MLIIPAVDIREGRCVRLVHGDPANETVYSEDPAEEAKAWAVQGAKRIHVVDLDAAMGKGSNLDLILRLRRAVSCEVQVGGGVRGPEVLDRLLTGGVDRVVLGTAIFKDPEWTRAALKKYPGRLMAGVDAREGEVRVEGWREGSGRPVAEAVRHVAALGFEEVIFTDIGRDGALRGVNVEATRAALSAARVGVYASGGVTSAADIRALKALEPLGLRGCVVGKALYDGRLSFAEALAAAR